MKRGYRKPRKVRPVEKDLPKGYDSGWEYKLHSNVLAKGRFWDYNEYNKYIWVRKSLKPNQELVFLFSSPSSPMPQAKRRKDGSKRSHAEWAEKNKFRWFSEHTLPKEWMK